MWCAPRMTNALSHRLPRACLSMCRTGPARARRSQWVSSHVACAARVTSPHECPVAMCLKCAHVSSLRLGRLRRAAASASLHILHVCCMTCRPLSPFTPLTTHALCQLLGTRALLCVFPHRSPRMRCRNSFSRAHCCVGRQGRATVSGPVHIARVLCLRTHR
jgi:hypothetical protein